jgi:SAM-dependent methyltransferase
LGGKDAFYEGAYRAQVHFNRNALKHPLGKLILPFINFGYIKLILDTVPPGSRVLELGCGGGMQLAGEHYIVSALDLSLSSLKGTPSSYKNKIHANALEVEFLPGSFDAVFGSCFFEHLAHAHKRALIEKIFRWLRPGGHLIMLFDTESLNPFFEWLRKAPVLYRQCIVEHDGHVGLEPVSINLKLFREQGFEKIRGIGLNRTLQHLPVYAWIAPYGQVNRSISVLSRFFDRIGRNILISLMYTASLHIWDISLGRLFPLDWSRLYLGCWRRP